MNKIYFIFIFLLLLACNTEKKQEKQAINQPDTFENQKKTTITEKEITPNLRA